MYHIKVLNKLIIVTFTLLSGVVFAQTNLAIGKAASQSTTCNSGNASRAVDGNTDGKYASNSTTHTCANKKNPWWEVNLGSSEQIGQIKIWNRVESSARLKNFRVQVLSSSRAVVKTIKNSGTAGYPTDLKFNVAGQYVRITLLTTTNPLSLAEVQVFERTGGPVINPEYISHLYTSVVYDGFQFVPGLPPIKSMKEGQEIIITPVNNSNVYLQLNPNDVSAGREGFVGWSEAGQTAVPRPDLWIFGSAKLIALPSINRWAVVGNAWDWL